MEQSAARYDYCPGGAPTQLPSVRCPLAFNLVPHMAASALIIADLHRSVLYPRPDDPSRPHCAVPPQFRFLEDVGLLYYTMITQLSQVTTFVQGW